MSLISALSNIVMTAASSGENVKTPMQVFLQWGIYGFIQCEESAVVPILTLFSVFCVIAAYLLGSINSAIIISKAVYHDDIRKHGSGNAGTTNMLRTYGKGAALATLICDIAKTALALALGGVMLGFAYVGGVSTNFMLYVVGLFAVLGHIFPVYYGMRGGKGVLSTATVALVLSPGVFALLFVIFVAVVAISKYVSLGSVCAAVLYPVVLNAYFQIFLNGRIPGIAALVAIILAITIVWCHRQNLRRIGERTEHKLSFKKKSDEGESSDAGGGDDK